MSRTDELHALAADLGPPFSACLLEIAAVLGETIGALESAESALDHARRTADPEVARTLRSAQDRAQRFLMTAA
jgi:hypothetical protein